MLGSDVEEFAAGEGDGGAIIGCGDVGDVVGEFGGEGGELLLRIWVRFTGNGINYVGDHEGHTISSRL